MAVASKVSGAVSGAALAAPFSRNITVRSLSAFAVPIFLGIEFAQEISESLSNLWYDLTQVPGFQEACRIPGRQAAQYGNGYAVFALFLIVRQDHFFELCSV